ncbi:MAG: hypothetical protein A2289_10420 [Deltaproteobacteria bacterium RIFOXYA12_FULL_58_15]|nr:MAG: hypothetical protein A2289_10420 [Deltaproteobacteria bacterium RIFOXYA12_FULL_58_15]OGR10048.1 MAG: hypothetical protein A2341_05405 [Deltaproteobacteria bacterium RIFOXYB12_FULL_58_9]
MTSSEARRKQKALQKVQRQLDVEVPTLEFDFGPAGLTQLGPIIVTDVGVAASHEESLRTAGKTVPKPVRCRLLLDTGADGCVLKHDVAEAVGLKLIAEGVPLHGVGVDTTGRVYMGRIWFRCPSKKVQGAEHTIAIETQITSGKLATDRIDGLIGRNALNRFELHYNGMTGRVTMRFHKP